jgi:hypothetical protein
MADIRTLKLALLADTKDFIQGLDKADKETRSFSDKLGGALKTGALAFAALGAAAAAASVKIGIDAVKAAMQDEVAQVNLARALKNTTDATDIQVAAVEKYISATARATGVNDGQLRPSFERLLRSTEDATKAQQLQTLALDISRGTGKDLLSVSDALGRAYEGQYKGLKDLGVELKTSITTTTKTKVSKESLAKAETAAEGATLRVTAAQEKLNKVLNDSGSDSLDVARAQNALEAAQQRAADATGKYEKSQDKLGKTIKTTKEVAVPFDDLVAQLTDKFGGQAAEYALTFAGRMDIVRNSFDEAKEELGFALLPLFEKFASFMEKTLIPIIDGLVAGFTRQGKQGLTKAFYDAGTGAVTFGAAMDTAEGQGYTLGDELRKLSDQFAILLAVDPATGESSLVKFIELLSTMIEKINGAIDATRRLKDSFNDSLVGQFVNAEGQFAPDAPVSGKLKGLVGIRTPVVTNNFILKGGVSDPQGYARSVSKIQTTANKTSGLGFGIR